MGRSYLGHLRPNDPPPCDIMGFVTRTARSISVERLGPSEQAAIRVLLDAFQDRGWRDHSGAAIAIVRILSAHPEGVSLERLARAIPERLLVLNSVSRAEVKSAIAELID